MPARTTYVALLRGINLGARNKLAMADLRTLVEGLGADDVSTYVQSGNVVFKAAAKADELAREIEERIRRDHGLQVPVLLRTKAQLAKLVTNNPFVKGRKDPAMLHVTFLADTPDRGRARKLDAQDAPPDEFHVVVVDIQVASDQLRAVLDDLNYRNLDELAEFDGQNTSTELLAQVVVDRLAARVKSGDLGDNAREITAIAATLRESHLASATYERAL